MWNGWISASSWLILFTLGLATARIAENLDWSWHGIFAPLYVLVGAFYCSTLSPFGDYRGACSGSKPTSASREETREQLEHSGGLVVFSFVTTTLLLATIILFANHLDSATPNFVYPLSVFLSLLIILFLYGLAQAYIGHKEHKEFSLLACCRRPFSRQYTDADIANVPIVVASYDSSYTWGLLFNVALYISFALAIIAVGLLIPYTRGTLSLTYVYVPAWIASFFIIISGLYALVRECGKSPCPCFEVFTLVLWILTIGLFVTFTILTLAVNVTEIYEILWPLYILFGLNGFIFCLFELEDCRRTPFANDNNVHDNDGERGEIRSVSSTFAFS